MTTPIVKHPLPSSIRCIEETRPKEGWLWIGIIYLNRTCNTIWLWLKIGWGMPTDAGSVNANINVGNPITWTIAITNDSCHIKHHPSYRGTCTANFGEPIPITNTKFHKPYLNVHSCWGLPKDQPQYPHSWHLKKMQHQELRATIFHAINPVSPKIWATLGPPWPCQEEQFGIVMLRLSHVQRKTWGSLLIPKSCHVKRHQA